MWVSQKLCIIFKKCFLKSKETCFLWTRDFLISYLSGWMPKLYSELCNVRSRDEIISLTFQFWCCVLLIWYSLDCYCSILENQFSFPGGSDGKESACNVGDLGSIPRLGGSPAEGMATHCSILAWRIPMDRGVRRATLHGVTKSWTWLINFHFHFSAPWSWNKWISFRNILSSGPWDTEVGC